VDAGLAVGVVLVVLDYPAGLVRQGYDVVVGVLVVEVAFVIRVAALPPMPRTGLGAVFLRLD